MKLLKWLLGILAAIGGIFAIFAGGNKRKKVKELKNKSKEISKNIKEKETKHKKIKESIKKKDKNIKNLKNKRDNIKVKDVSTEEAKKYLKKYTKKKK